MPKKFPYKVFPEYIIRTPLFSLNNYYCLVEKGVLKGDDFKRLISRTQLFNGILLASPGLHKEISKWLDGQITESKKIKKIEESIFKYFTRASSRCSPFGLFAGCAIGKVDERTNLIMNPDSNEIFIRYNTNYIEEVLLSNIRNKTTGDSIFYTNSSIYSIGFNYRYIEPYIIEQKLKYRISEVPHSGFLKYLLSEAKNGISLIRLQKNFYKKFSDKVSESQSISFIDEVIKSKILVSNFELSVTDQPSLTQIKNKINDSNLQSQNIKNLNFLESMKSKLNSPYYRENLSQVIYDLKKKSKKPTKSPIDIEMYPNFHSNTISDKVIDQVKQVLGFLNKISFYPKERQLEAFIKKFIDRYGERKVPITVALDVESGITFKSSFQNTDYNPLIDDLSISSKSLKSHEQTISWNETFDKLKSIIDHALSDKQFIVNLDNEEWENAGNSWTDLPDTFTAMINFTGESNHDKIEFLGSGGSSAINLISRFGYGNSEIYKYAKKIAQKEKDLNPGKILAEIAHIPEYRIFNILNRPTVRDFEIRYLSGHQNKCREIDINDILLHIANGKELKLTSKKYKKEIIPYLSTAHTYQNNKSLPIYHFLSEFQFYKKRKSLFFEIGPLKNKYEFIPRFEFNGVILSRATWNLKKEDFKTWYSLKDDWEELKIKISTFLKVKQIPNMVNLIDGEEKIGIYFKNYNSVKMFLDYIKNKQHFQLVEDFSNQKNPVVDQKGHNYNHEILLGFYKDYKIKTE